MNNRERKDVWARSGLFSWNSARYLLAFFLTLWGYALTPVVAQAAPRFSDVSRTHWAFSYIETLATNGITNGCTAAEYCPDDDVDRAQMAVFLLRAEHGRNHVPPTSTGTVFSDVSAAHWAAAWIEQLASEGITGGCGDGNYCPGEPLTRAQMAVFLLRAKYGQGYVPPAATGTVFDDVPSTHWAAAWIEQLASEGITSGCDASNYCPGASLTRAQMAVFIVKTFGLQPLVSREQAVRFLNMATFGATKNEVEYLRQIGIEDWVDEQLNAPSAYDSDSDDHLSYAQRMIDIAIMADPVKWNHTREEYLDTSNDIVFNREYGAFHPQFYFNSTWFENALNAQDQLRQRVAYALSQILVISPDGEKLLSRRWEAFAYHNDILAKYAFGNYRDLLLAITKSPGMGVFLTYQGNEKGDPVTHRQPDENYARELMQLFSIGLFQLNLDGTPKLDANGHMIPTYTQADIEEMARVFTGWDLSKNSRYGLQSPQNNGNYLEDMEFTAQYHDDGEKTVLGHTIPAGQGIHDIEAAIDVLMQNDSMAPFISKLLIQRLVTSNPTPAYVARVATVFNDNGNGVKGDLKAVVRAILLDDEALRGEAANPHFARYKEPLIAYTQLLRAFDVHYAPTWNSKWIFGQDAMSMHDVYYFDTEDLKAAFGQAPMRSPTVFNFYSPDYVPNDSHFKDNDLVAPEMQIQSAQMMINYSNYLWDRLDVNEELRDTTRMHSRYRITFVPEKDIVMRELRDYSNMSNDTYKGKAIDALLPHLNDKMTNGEMDATQLNAIKTHLMQTSYSTNLDGVRKMIRDAVYAFATSSTYMVQR